MMVMMIITYNNSICIWIWIWMKTTATHLATRNTQCRICWGWLFRIRYSHNYIAFILFRRNAEFQSLWGIFIYHKWLRVHSGVQILSLVPPLCEISKITSPQHLLVEHGPFEDVFPIEERGPIFYCHVRFFFTHPEHSDPTPKRSFSALVCLASVGVWFCMDFFDFHTMIFIHPRMHKIMQHFDCESTFTLDNSAIL